MISLVGVHLSYGPRTILRWIDLNIQDGECLAVVGPNGCGKSTLLRVIAGLEQPDSGQVCLPNNISIGYLPQESDLSVDHSLREELLEAFSSIRSAMEEMASLEKQMGKTDPDSQEHDRILERYGELGHYVEHENGYMIEAQVRMVSAGLGFTPIDLDRPCREFSGGWQMRILLAQLLLRKPDVLLLDEPTNHLDLESTLWLEQWIRTCGRTVILVSHERATMDRLAHRIVCMERGKADVYPGSYSNYLKLSQARREAEWEAYERQRKEIESVEAFIRRFRYNASKAALVQSRIKQLQKIERLDPPFHPTAIDFNFPEAPPSYREVLRLEDLSHSYGEHSVLRGLNLTIHRGEKVGLVGINGAGKSTLLRILAGRETPSEGRYCLGEQVNLTYFAQYDTSTLDSQTTLLEAIEATAPVGKGSQARNLLGAFLFSGEEVGKPLRALSGGERTRFRLAQILFSPANFLLLDEPTNHLDVTSRATVEKALKNYTGTVIVVSHDRVFMDRVTNRIVEIENGNLRTYPGKYNDYLQSKEQQFSGDDTEPGLADNPSGDSSGLDAKEQRIQEYQERKIRQRIRDRLDKQIEKIEREIEQNESQMGQLDREMGRPDTAADYSRLGPLTEKRLDLDRQQGRLLEKWEELHRELEELDG